MGPSEFYIDFSFGDFISTTISSIKAGEDLAAAIGGTTASMPAATMEQQIAEKFHALARIYLDGEENPRTKDLFDIALMLRLNSGDLDMVYLAKTLKEVFAYRESMAGYSLPHDLPEFPKKWESYFEQMMKGQTVYLEYKAAETIVRTLYSELLLIVG